MTAALIKRENFNTNPAQVGDNEKRYEVKKVLYKLKEDAWDALFPHNSQNMFLQHMVLHCLCPKL